MQKYRMRRVIGLLVVAVFGWFVANYATSQPETAPTTGETTRPALANVGSAADALEKLQVKGRAPKTGYSRDQFGPGWESRLGCDTRNTILHRDLADVRTDERCRVVSGTLNDPYTGKLIQFIRGESTSALVQIDHVVALSDSWQKGAQQLPYERRVALANDPLNLLAVDGPANQEKSDGDAATWLPSLKAFRCQYVARQIAVKKTYELWITGSEKTAMERVLASCPSEPLPY